MSTTYRTVINKAITDFNSIQDALRTIGVKNGDYLIATSGTSSAVPSGTLSSLITEQLGLKPNGTLTISGSGSVNAYRNVTININSSSSTTKSVPYETISVPSAEYAGNGASISFPTTDNANNTGVNVIASLLDTANITTSEPSGKNFIIVSASGSSKITTAGWIGTGGLTAGAATKYIPVKSGALSASTGSCWYNSASNVTTSDTNNGISISFKGKGSVSVGTAGYLAAGTSATSNDSGAATKYITGITVPKDKAFSLTATADTVLDDTSNITLTNAGYRRMAITNAANGTLEINGGPGTSGGVTVDGANGKTVSVSSGNSSSASTVTVTDTNGFLITTGVSGVTMGTNVGLSYTNNTGMYVYMEAFPTIENNHSKAGWVSSSASDSITAYIESIIVPANKTLAITNNGTVTGLYTYDPETFTLTLK